MHRPGGFGFLTVILFLTATAALQAGVRREIQDQYERQYVNRTFFLRIPIHGARQELLVRPGGVTPFSGPSETGLTFKVGEQIRITQIKFGGQEIRLQASSVDLSRENEIVFRFPTQLEDSFSQRSLFDEALDKVLTEGLTNQEIDNAKQDFLKREFGRMLQEMAQTTGSAPDFVLRSISGEIPAVEQSRRRAAQAESQLEQARSQLEEEGRRRQQAESSLQQVRRQNADNESAVDSLKLEREKLVDDNSALQREVNRLKGSSDEYKKQIEEMARALDVRTSSADDLSRSLSRLNQTVENLKAERDSLSGQLETANRNLEEKTQESQKLASDLSSAQAERNKLRRDLNSLTSDRKSLSSRFIETQNAKERLETILALGNALRLEPHVEERPEGTFVVADLLLQGRKIGTLEVQQPESAGQNRTVKFSVDSPDTVQLSPEERKLREALGEALKLETVWRSSSPQLSIALSQGEAVREVPPRESALWEWRFEGEVSQPQQATLLTQLVADKGEKIPVGELRFDIYPAGLAGSFSHSFSLTWLAVGGLLGMLAMLPVLYFRTRPRTPSRRPPARPKAPAPAEGRYVTQKKF